MDMKKIEAEISSVLANHEEIRFAYLFGSATRTEFFADIDIGIMLVDDFLLGATYPEALGSEIEKKLKQNLEFMKPVEIHILNGVKSVRFLNSALRTARLLFTRDEAARVRFEVRITQDYLDLKSMYEQYDQMRMVRY